MFSRHRGKLFFFSIHHRQRSRLPLINAALHMFKSSDELLNTCGRCCSWHGRSGKLAHPPGLSELLLLRPAAAVLCCLTSSSRLAGALHSSSKALSSRASQSGCFSRTPKFKADTLGEKKKRVRKPQVLAVARRHLEKMEKNSGTTLII